MKKPNVFIIGAPKCGTTSLARWLSDHPQVFFSSRKEPQFFNLDYGLRRYKTLANYEELFLEADEKHKIVCEASTCYLYSRAAVPEILKYKPDARFIVMLRNPVEMAVSLHEQTYFIGDENEPDFAIAWSLQARRAAGDFVPVTCSERQHLQYGEICKLGSQLKRLFELVDRDRVHLIRLDDIKSDTPHVYARLLDFLGIEDDGRADFPVHNAAKARRFRSIWQVVRGLNIRWTEAGLPKFRVGLTAKINSWTRRERPRSSIDEALKSDLRNYFSDDIRLLESLTDWNLSHWLSPDPKTHAVTGTDSSSIQYGLR